MKVYLAARYERRRELLKIKEKLEQIGVTVTSRWLRGEHEVSNHLVGTDAELEFQKGIALEDAEDIQAADCLIEFAEAAFPSPLKTRPRGGKFWEAGAAYAASKRIIKVGGHEIVFDSLPRVEHVNNVRALITMLGEELHNG